MGEHIFNGLFFFLRLISLLKDILLPKVGINPLFTFCKKRFNLRRISAAAYCFNHLIIATAFIDNLDTYDPTGIGFFPYKRPAKIIFNSMGHLNGCPRKYNFLIINKLEIRLKLWCQSQENLYFLYFNYYGWLESKIMNLRYMDYISLKLKQAE